MASKRNGQKTKVDGFPKQRSLPTAIFTRQSHSLEGEGSKRTLERLRHEKIVPKRTSGITDKPYLGWKDPLSVFNRFLKCQTGLYATNRLLGRV